MENKTPMEYLFNFFFRIGDIFLSGLEQVVSIGWEEWKESQKDDLIDVNSRENRLPAKIRDKQGQANMDISREDYQKLSRKEKNAYKAQWNSLSEQEKEKRRGEFAKKQEPKLKKAVEEYYAEQKKAGKSKEAVDQALGLSPGEQIQLYDHKEQFIPRRVAEEMAAEIRTAGSNMPMPLDVSRKEFEKMSNRQRRNYLDSWAALKPEERAERLRAFEKNQKNAISAAWEKYEKHSGKIVMQKETDCFSFDGRAMADYTYQLEEAEKKKKAAEKQKDELKAQKLDGKKQQEKENERKKEAGLEEKKPDAHVENGPEKQAERGGSFSGKREERRNLQDNHELNRQIGKIKQPPRYDNLQVFDQQDQKDQKLVENIAKQYGVRPEELKQGKNRENIKEGAERRKEKAKNEKALENGKNMERQDGVRKNDQPMLPAGRK